MYLYASDALSIIFVHSHVFSRVIIDDFIEKGYMNKSKNTVMFLSFSWYYPATYEYIERLLNTEYFDHDNFYIFLNSPEELEMFNRDFPGRHAHYVSNCIWIDDEAFTVLPLCNAGERPYDAVLNAKAASFKNHHLAKEVDNLCLICEGVSDAVDQICEELDPVYISNTTLLYEDIGFLVNKSYVGLMLSEEEGACYASAEYLACGVPVVSVESRGGRHVFYNDDNSMICDADPESVADAVAVMKQRMINGEICPQNIRDKFLSDIGVHRQSFVAVLQSVFDRFGVPENALTYLETIAGAVKSGDVRINNANVFYSQYV